MLFTKHDKDASSLPISGLENLTDGLKDTFLQIDFYSNSY